jgi:hypothetical protein
MKMEAVVVDFVSTCIKQSITGSNRHLPVLFRYLSNHKPGLATFESRKFLDQLSNYWLKCNSRGMEYTRIWEGPRHYDRNMEQASTFAKAYNLLQELPSVLRAAKKILII